MNVSPIQDKDVNSSNEDIVVISSKTNKPSHIPPTPPLATEGCDEEDDKAAAGGGSVSRKSSGGRKRGWKKPRDKPKRPLSAYNLFFQYQRERILNDAPDPGAAKPRRSHGKIGFAPLARSIAAKWSKIDSSTRSHFEGLAAKDKERYNREMKAWNDRMRLSKLTEGDSMCSNSNNHNNNNTNMADDSVIPSFTLMQQQQQHRSEQQLKRHMSFNNNNTPAGLATYLPHLNEWTTLGYNDRMSGDPGSSDDSVVAGAETDCPSTILGQASAYGRHHQHLHHAVSEEYSISGHDEDGGGGGDIANEMNEAMRLGDHAVYHLSQYNGGDDNEEDAVRSVRYSGAATASSAAAAAAVAALGEERALNHHHHQRQQLFAQQQPQQRHLQNYQESFFNRSPSPECVPFPLSNMGRRPSIAELASKLDSDSMDLLSALLRS